MFFFSIFWHDFARTLMLCSANFITKTSIKLCFSKMLSCLLNISFNVLTFSVIRLCATQQKVNSLKFLCVLNSTYHEMICPQWNSVKSVSVCLPWQRLKLVWSISFCLLALVASGNQKPSLWLAGYRKCQSLGLFPFLHTHLGTGRILKSYGNLRLHLGLHDCPSFSQLPSCLDEPL